MSANIDLKAQDERAAFEAWITEDCADEALNRRVLERNDDGSYLPERVRDAWEVWQARAALAAAPAATQEVQDDLGRTLARLDSPALAAWVDRAMSLAENVALYVQADCPLRESQARDALRAHLFSVQPAADPHPSGDSGQVAGGQAPCPHSEDCMASQHCIGTCEH